jgi:hypothetical protein
VLAMNIGYCLAEQRCPFGGEDARLSLLELLDKGLTESHRFCGVEWYVAPEV